MKANRLFLVALLVLLAPVLLPAARVEASHGAVHHFPGTMALGDSVMLGAAPFLQQRDISVNAVVGRQFFQGTDLLAGMRAVGELPPRVVIGLGTNGPFTAGQFDAMMQVLRNERRVVFVTVKEPRYWEGQVNAVLRAGVTRWRNARLADWYGLAIRNPGWTCCDGIHLSIAGARAYARVVAHGLRVR